MIVYVVVRQVLHEDADIVGIFSTEEKALNFVEKLANRELYPVSVSELDVTEWEVDAE